MSDHMIHPSWQDAAERWATAYEGAAAERDRALADLKAIRDAVASACPMWAMEWPQLVAKGQVADSDPFTAQEVRNEVAPIFDAIAAAGGSDTTGETP